MKIIISIALLISLSGCATIFCNELCQGDDLCYTLCSGQTEE